MIRWRVTNVAKKALWIRRRYGRDAVLVSENFERGEIVSPVGSIASKVVGT